MEEQELQHEPADGNADADDDVVDVGDCVADEVKH